jgi:hypothetical protein
MAIHPHRKLLLVRLAESLLPHALPIAVRNNAFAQLREPAGSSRREARNKSPCLAWCRRGHGVVAFDRRNNEGRITGLLRLAEVGRIRGFRLFRRKSAGRFFSRIPKPPSERHTF